MVRLLAWNPRWVTIMSVKALATVAVAPALIVTFVALSTEFHHSPGLTRFLPASLSADGNQVTPVPWSGSGDVMAMARANAFLVAEPDKPDYAAGERIRVLVR